MISRKIQLYHDNFLEKFFKMIYWSYIVIVFKSFTFLLEKIIILILIVFI